MSNWQFWKLNRFLGLCAWFLVLGCGSSTTLQIEYDVVSGASTPSLIVKISMAPDGTTKEDVALEGGQKFGGNANALLGCAKALGLIDSTNGDGNVVNSGTVDGATCIAELGTYLNSLNVTSGFEPPHTSGRMTLITDHTGYVFVLTFFNLGTGSRCVYLSGAEVRDRKFFIKSTGQSSTTLNFTASATGKTGPVTAADAADGTSKCFTY